MNLDQLGLLRIGLEHRVGGEAGLLQIGLYPGDRIVRLRADRFLHHHLQHQVDAALEVKTKVDAVGQCRLPGGRANALRNAEDAKDENEKNCNDQKGFTHGSRNQVFRRAYCLPAKYGYLASSWLVVTEAIALLMTSNLMPSVERATGPRPL